MLGRRVSKGGEVGEPLQFSPDPDGLLPPVGVASGAPASHRFRVQRPRDLVNLQVSAYGCVLVGVGSRVVLRPSGTAARLEVRLPYQHLGEQSFVQGEPTPQQIRARAADGSRLVFEVPQATMIDYSVEGILAALSQLPLIVVPAAQPRPPAKGAARTLIVALPGGVGLFRGTDGLVLKALTKKEQAAHARTDRTAVERVLASSVDLNLARQVLARESATDLTKGALPDYSDLIVGPVIFKPLKGRPREPRSNETSLEAPYRLILSPTAQGGFAHATTPVEAPSGRVELWHSRLGVRVEGAQGVTVNETNVEQRVVRAVWARDLDGGGPPPTHQDVPFRMPLDGRDRSVIVRQTSDPASPTPLLPVDAHKLYVSALGAYLDLSASWEQDPQTKITPEILSWDHIASMGRDQFVKVVYPGYLFPFGHAAALVKQTTRQVQSLTDPVARLFTEFFLVVSQPVKAYSGLDMPFKEIRIRPLVSPGLLDPNDGSSGSQVTPGDGTPPYGQKLFWPKLASDRQDVQFVLECLDQDGQRRRLATPLLFVGQTIGRQGLDGMPRNEEPKAGGAKLKVSMPKPAHVTGAWDNRPIDGREQSIAFAPSATPGETAMQTATLRFTGVPNTDGTLGARPTLVDADVVIPAIQQVGPPGAAQATTVVYPKDYLASGFGPGNSVLEQFLQLKSQADVAFTKSSDRGGGFLAPNIGVQALTRRKGAVGDVTGYTPDGLKPEVAFGTDLDLLPKLFGVFSLTQLLGDVVPSPTFASSALDGIKSLQNDLALLTQAVDTVAKRMGADAASAATQGLRDAAAAARNELTGALGSLSADAAAFDAAIQKLQDVHEPSDVAAVTTALAGIPATLLTSATGLRTAMAGVMLPTAARAEIERPLTAVIAVLETADDLLKAISAFVSGLTAAGLTQKASYTWTTPLSNFPKGGADNALFVASNGGRGSVLSMHVEAGPSGADVTAEITDFTLNLFPGAPLIALLFDRLAFHAAAGRKADVDVVFDGIEFQGVLGFVNTLKDLVPFDGFSDPPYLDIDSSGLRAGFDLALPAVSVGVFSLENIALHAGVDIPFLGEALTVGFSFCTREKPFRLTVMMIGGGGFVGLTLSPKGLVVLEMSLEAGASLSIDLGVASGSVSVMVGVYLRLEGEAGSLTGYFRIRGEVDVLGLISASITLELSLTYHFASGKLIGRASIEVEVDVLLFSGSVSVSCERKLAGSNGDPTFAQVLSIDAGQGTAPEWDTYCAAFAAD